jgi:hypothetical protein
MEKKNNVITFEDLDNNISFENNDLINADYYNSPDFFEQYYKKYNKMPLSSIREECYLKWHKELGNSIYDKETGKLKAAPISDKMTFLKSHPYLTLKDNKNITVIRNNLDEKHKRSFIISYIGGLILFSFYVRFRVGRQNFRKFIFTNKGKILLGITMSVIGYDILYKLRMRNVFLDNILENKGFKKRYFENYLI